MNRTIKVTSHHEGDALVRVLDVPALKSVQVITGLLLELDDATQHRVLTMVENSIALVRATNHGATLRRIEDPHEEQRLHLADAGASGE